MDDLFQDENNAIKVDYAELIHKVIYRAKIVLRRYWWIIPLCVALVVAFKAVEGLVTAPTYVSSARMIVSGRIALPENDVYSEERDNFFGTQIELMTSDQVRARAFERIKLTQPELHEALVATDEYTDSGIRSLKVYADVKNDTSIFELYAYTPDQKYSQVFLDAVMDEFINRRQEMRSKTSEKTYDAIAAQIESLEEEINRSEDAIVEFQKKNNIVFIQEQGSAAGTYLADLKRRLAELKTESRALASIADSSQVDTLLSGDAAQAASDGAQGNLVAAVGSRDDNEKYLAAKAELDQLKAELEEFQIYLKPKHPKIINLKDQIERTANQLKIQRRQAFDRIGERKLVVESLIRNLNQEIEIWEQTALENGQLIAEFERLQSRLARSKAAYELTLDEAVQQTAYEHLDFISIGGHPDHPAELLMSNNMAKFIDDAREKYEFIIFDTAPILATDDTTSFAGQMDALLFTIRCAHTQIRQVKPAMARLRERHIEISGLFSTTSTPRNLVTTTTTTTTTTAIRSIIRTPRKTRIATMQLPPARNGSQSI